MHIKRDSLGRAEIVDGVGELKGIWDEPSKTPVTLIIRRATPEDRFSPSLKYIAIIRNVGSAGKKPVEWSEREAFAATSPEIATIKAVISLMNRMQPIVGINVSLPFNDITKILESE